MKSTLADSYALVWEKRFLVNRCSCENNHGPGINCTEEQHQQNRRTELRIIGIETPENPIILPSNRNPLPFNPDEPAIGQEFYARPDFYYHSRLRPEGLFFLDSIAGILKSHSNIIWEIASHSDCRGSIEYNDAQTQSVSNTYRNYLLKKGIDSTTLIAKGYGERQLLNDCACEPNDQGHGVKCTEEQHQQNHRTVITIVGFKD